jgi:hypothetical protein
MKITMTKNWFKEYDEWRKRAESAERLLSKNLTSQEIGRAHHIADLETKNARLKQQVRMMQEKAEEVNKILFATKLIVNCTGCLPGGPDDCENLTEEKIQEVENIAKRLRTWWNNNKSKIYTQPSE